MRNIVSTQDAPLRRLDDDDLTEDFLLVAKEQLNESEEVREMCLQVLRILIKREKHLLANESEDFLLQFLRVKKFCPNAAFSQLKKFYRHRMMYPKLYKCYSPKQNLGVLKKNLINFLPHRTPEGCAVLVSRIGLWNPEEFDFDQFLRCGLLLTEKALQNPLTQIAGLVSLVDFQGLSWSHLSHMPLNSIKCFVQAIQESFPIRHKQIHVVNNPSIFGYLFTLVRPFLTDTIKQRIHFHGYALESLHQFLPLDLLPEEYGGTQGQFKNEEFYKVLLESEHEFINGQKYGYLRMP